MPLSSSFARVAGLLFAGAVTTGPISTQSTGDRGPMVALLDARLTSMEAALRALSVSVAKSDLDGARASFRNARKQYKRGEFLITAYSPTTASILNGPADSDDPDSPPSTLGTRSGFGLVEHALFGEHPSLKDTAAIRSISTMIKATTAFRAAMPLLVIPDTSAVDAMRNELARVMTLGIAGFDSGESGDALSENISALNGILDGLGQLSTRQSSRERAAAANALNEAVARLSKARDFDTLDRFEFISHTAILASRAVFALRVALDAEPISARRLWRPASASPFDGGAFDPAALAPEYAPPTTKALVDDGRTLFFDPRLSGSGTRSCATCHQPSRAFTDGRRVAASLDSGHVRMRNTPTLLNAALQQTMFADERAGFVEDQIRMVLTSPAEMASSLSLAAKRTGKTEMQVRVALAAYVRSLTALDSRFDRAIRGDTNAISAAERRGFNLFMGKAACGTCHFAPLFSGTTPPDFVRSELEIIGTPAAAVTRNARVDPDSGRERVDGWMQHRFAFRVPTVRNSAVTAPYMHNGVFKTLDEVVDFYDRGGGVGIGERLPSQTLSTKPLHLSTREKTDLVAFLGALTDTTARY